MLSSVYSRSFVHGAGALGELPAEYIGIARESIGAALAIAAQAGEPLAPRIVLLARQSFMDGWHVLALVACALSLAGALLAGGSMPRRQTKIEGSAPPKA